MAALYTVLLSHITDKPIFSFRGIVVGAGCSLLDGQMQGLSTEGNIPGSVGEFMVLPGTFHRVRGAWCEENF